MIVQPANDFMGAIHTRMPAFVDPDDVEGWLSGEAGLEMLKPAGEEGGGIACLARFQGDRKGRLRRLRTPRAAPEADIWLLVHKDSCDIPRVTAALVAITTVFKSISGTLDPRN